MTSTQETKRVGLIIFWIGAAYMIGMSFIAGWSSVSPTFRYLSSDQVNETIWAMNSPLFWAWAFSVPLGSILAGIGILLHARSKGSHIWLFGIGVFAVLVVANSLRFAHFPPLFGLGGGLILVFFLAMLWLWARKYATLEGAAKTAANFQLVGYVFLLIAMWFLCGILSMPFMKSLSDLPPSSPVAIMVYLVLGWLFLFLSHWKSAQATKK